MSDNKAQNQTAIIHYTADLLNGPVVFEIGIENGLIKAALPGTIEFVWLTAGQRLRVTLEPTHAEQTPVLITALRIPS